MPGQYCIKTHEGKPYAVWKDRGGGGRVCVSKFVYPPPHKKSQKEQYGKKRTRKTKRECQDDHTEVC